MNLKRYLLETVTLIVAAVICATVANLLSSRERKIAFVADYPNALVVPGSRESDPAPAPSTMTASPSTAGAESPVAVPSAESTAGEASKSPASAESATAATSQPATPVTAAPVAPTRQTASLEEMIARFPPHDTVPYLEIAPSDVDWLYDNGVLFIDARRTRDYEAGHIKGAKAFPIWEADIDDRVAALANEGLDGRRPIVLYCSGGDCEDSHMLAQKLWGILLNNVLVYKDGFPDWQKRGRPVSRGSAP